MGVDRPVTAKRCSYQGEAVVGFTELKWWRRSAAAPRSITRLVFACGVKARTKSRPPALASSCGQRCSVSAGLKPMNTEGEYQFFRCL